MIIDGLEFLSIIEKHIKVKNPELLLKAYDFAKKAHEGQLRNSGDPYFTHPLAVAIHVSTLKLDEASVISALLHDTVEDTNTTLQDITKIFGKEIAYLVDGLTKIESAKFKSKNEDNAENFRKLILTTAKDIRVLIIKLSDVLHNMQTIKGMHNEERQARFSEQTLMIYVPLAERIGMYKMKLELEDLCFEELFPKERQEILKNIKKTKRNQKNIIDDIIKKLKVNFTFENKIECRIIGREKKPYSIWKKMQKKSISFEKLKDIIAFRVIVKNIQDCYKVLGCINSHYIMVPDTFKDYINKPKLNGYQSLHIVVIGPTNIKIEIQIRTEEMDKIAEYALAYHWMYKQSIKKENQLQEYNILKQLIQNIETTDYDTEKFNDLKYEIYEDEIFCYTPKGDIINLQIGSTGLDFAFEIHKEVGLYCSGVKINGVLTQFKKPLSSGDEVEILTSKTPQVNEEWLNYVKTSKARSDIKNYIRKSRQKEFEELGRYEIEAISKELKIKIDDNTIEKKLNNFKFKISNVSNFYVLVAEGKISKSEIINVLFPEYNREEIPTDELIQEKFSNIKFQTNNAIGVQGLDKNVAYKYAKCCYPLPPNQIVGVINSGTGITIHRKDCKILSSITDDRIIDLEWNNNDSASYIAKLNITFESKAGILAKVVNLCAEKKINIITISTKNESSFYQEMELKIEIKNQTTLENFKASIRSLQYVVDVE